MLPVFVFVFVLVLVMTVGRTVSTLAALSTLEGETMGMAYCVCGVSGRLSEEENDAAVRECVSSSSLSMDVPSPLIPVFAQRSAALLIFIFIDWICTAGISNSTLPHVEEDCLHPVTIGTHEDGPSARSLRSGIEQLRELMHIIYVSPIGCVAQLEESYYHTKPNQG